MEYRVVKKLIEDGSFEEITWPEIKKGMLLQIEEEDGTLVGKMIAAEDAAFDIDKGYWVFTGEFI